MRTKKSAVLQATNFPSSDHETVLSRQHSQPQLLTPSPPSRRYPKSESKPTTRRVDSDLTSMSDYDAARHKSADKSSYGAADKSSYLGGDGTAMWSPEGGRSTPRGETKPRRQRADSEMTSLSGSDGGVDWSPVARRSPLERLASLQSFSSVTVMQHLNSEKDTYAIDDKCVSKENVRFVSSNGEPLDSPYRLERTRVLEDTWHEDKRVHNGTFYQVRRPDDRLAANTDMKRFSESENGNVEDDDVAVGDSESVASTASSNDKLYGGLQNLYRTSSLHRHMLESVVGNMALKGFRELVGDWVCEAVRQWEADYLAEGEFEAELGDSFRSEWSVIWVEEYHKVSDLEGRYVACLITFVCAFL